MKKCFVILIRVIYITIIFGLLILGNSEYTWPDVCRQGGNGVLPPYFEMGEKFDLLQKKIDIFAKQNSIENYKFEENLEDTWGNKLIHEKSRYLLISKGPDKKINTIDDCALFYGHLLDNNIFYYKSKIIFKSDLYQKFVVKTLIWFNCLDKLMLIDSKKINFNDYRKYIIGWNTKTKVFKYLLENRLNILIKEEKRAFAGTDQEENYKIYMEKWLFNYKQFGKWIHEFIG